MKKHIKTLISFAVAALLMCIYHRVIIKLFMLDFAVNHISIMESLKEGNIAEVLVWMLFYLCIKLFIIQFYSMNHVYNKIKGTDAECWFCLIGAGVMLLNFCIDGVWISPRVWQITSAGLINTRLYDFLPITIILDGLATCYLGFSLCDMPDTLKDMYRKHVEKKKCIQTS